MEEIKKDDMTVEQWIRIWQREYRSFIKESTFATYSVAIENHIFPYFAERKIKDIDCNINQEFILSLAQKKKRMETDIYQLKL